ncbi:MAG: hypothetical protein O2816_14605 [Planctomycetota bacterium]|nr:hypothetical protein [Planctomycetota bacterium]
MVSTLLARTMRALPLYLFAVVVVLGIAQVLQNTTVVAADRTESVEPQPFVPAVPPVQLTLVIGGFPLPLPLLVPTITQ